MKEVEALAVMLAAVVGVVLGAVLAVLVALPLMGYLFGFAGYFLTPLALFLSLPIALIGGFAGAMFFSNQMANFIDRKRDK